MKAKNQDIMSLIESMTLFHSPMIKVVFGHRECVNEIIDIILGRHIHIDEHHVEHYMSNIKGREAQFDIYVKSEKMRINVEIQRKEKGANPKRGRLNLSLIDTQEIKKSSEYEEVPESYIVFMCEGDYFKKGLPIYHLKLTNKETKEEVDIGQEMIYVNGDYQDEETVLGRLIHDFHCIDPNEMYSEVFKKWVKYYKEERKGVTEMCEICEQLKEMGRIEGEVIGEKRGYANGKVEGKAEGKIEKAAQMIINLLIKKLGSLSEYIVNKINSSDETTLDILAINIFDIDKEEDILKYILS